MSVYKRGNVWSYGFSFNKKRIQKSTKQGNKRIAEQMEAAHKTALAKGEVGIVDKKSAPAFDPFADEFLVAVKAARSPATHRRYGVSLVSLRGCFGRRRLDEITVEHIEQYKLKRLGDGRSNATVNRDLACLRRMLRLAVKQKKLPNTPFADRSIEFLEERGRERVLTFAEERKYLKVANPTLRDVAILMLETGMRPDELFRLRQEDVNLPQRYLHVRTGKTKNARRSVFLTDAAVEVVKGRFSEAKGPYLFPFRVATGQYDWDRPMTQLWNAHRKALEESKISPAFKLYDLRHTYGTRAAESGMDPFTLMRLMGHASLRTTDNYIKLSKRHLADAQKKLEIYKVERIMAEAGEDASEQPQ